MRSKFTFFTCHLGAVRSSRGPAAPLICKRPNYLCGELCRFVQLHHSAPPFHQARLMVSECTGQSNLNFRFLLPGCRCVSRSKTGAQSAQLAPASIRQANWIRVASQIRRPRHSLMSQASRCRVSTTGGAKPDQRTRTVGRLGDRPESSQLDLARCRRGPPSDAVGRITTQLGLMPVAAFIGAQAGAN